MNKVQVTYEYDYFKKFCREVQDYYKNVHYEFNTNSLNYLSSDELENEFIPRFTSLIKKGYSVTLEKPGQPYIYIVATEVLSHVCRRPSDGPFNKLMQLKPDFWNLFVTDGHGRNDLLKLKKLDPNIRRAITEHVFPTLKLDKHSTDCKTLLIAKKFGSFKQVTLTFATPPTESDLELLLHSDIHRLGDIARNTATSSETLKVIYKIAKRKKVKWLCCEVLEHKNCDKAFLQEIFETTTNALELKSLMRNPSITGVNYIK